MQKYNIKTDDIKFLLGKHDVNNLPLDVMKALAYHYAGIHDGNLKDVLINSRPEKFISNFDALSDRPFYRAVDLMCKDLGLEYTIYFTELDIREIPSYKNNEWRTGLIFIFEDKVEDKKSIEKYQKYEDETFTWLSDSVLLIKAQPNCHIVETHINARERAASFCKNQGGKYIRNVVKEIIKL